MPTLARLCISMGLVCFATAAYSQGRPWFDGQSRRTAGESTSSVKAKIQNPRPIKAPGSEVPESIKGLSGRWIGWAGDNRDSSVAVDVEELTAKGGTLAYFLASSSFTTPYELRTSAVLMNGNELEGNIGGQTYIKMRLRPDGFADFMVYWGSGARAGVLAKESAHPKQQLSDRELREVLVGSRAIYANTNATVFRSDGSYSFISGGVARRNGHYTIANGEVCYSLNGAPPRNCDRIFRDANGYELVQQSTGNRFRFVTAPADNPN